MTTRKDKLSTEVSISAKLEERGISLGAKSRFVSSVDRLLGCLADIPSSYLEGVAERIRLRSAQTSKRLREQRADNERLIEDLIESAGNQRQLESMVNKTIVVEKALEHLDAEPEGATSSIESEWLNAFERYAECATSDRLRDIWARVLAGEVHRPGNFSLMTLRFISELDSEVAKLFERIATVRSKSGTIPAPAPISGQMFIDMNLLQEVGLLQHVGGLAHIELQVMPDGCFYYTEDDYSLQIKTKSGERKLQVSMIFLTRIGREICSILPKRDELELMKRLAASIGNQAESLHIFQVAKRLPDGSAQLRPHSKVK